MLTQCPHCTASFRVSDAQLQAAHGKVRCGACMEIFNAAKHLNTDDPTRAKDHQPEDIFAGLDHDDEFEALTDSPPAEDTISSGYIAAASGLDSSGNEDETSANSGVKPSLQADETHNDFSETFKDLATWDGVKRSFQPKTEKGNGQDHSHTGTFPDLSIQTPDGRPKRSQPKKSGRKLVATEEARAQVADEQHQDETIPADSRWLKKSDRQITALRAEPVSIRPTLRVDRSGEWLKKFAIVGGITIVVAFVFAQLAWFQFDRLARQGYLRPVYSQACQLFGCQLPSPYDIKQIRSQNLVVRNHPLENKALIIDAIVVNKAGFEQPFPDITFTFSDLNNRVITKEVFSPDEYLSGEAKNMLAMPTDTPVHIALEILDPGKNAVNYNMGFVPNQAYQQTD